MHVKMAILADKYDIRDLGKLAYVSLAEALDNGVEPNDDLLDAIHVAWEVDVPTKGEQKKFMDAVLKPAFSADHLEMVIDAHPRFARDVAMAQKRAGEPLKRPEFTFDLGPGTQLECPICHRLADVEVESSNASVCECPYCHKVSMGSRWHEPGLFLN